MLEGFTLKRTIYRKYVASFLALIMVFGLFPSVNKAQAEDILDINGDAAILVEAETGRVLYAKNADQVLGIASMTKMMTEYLLLEAIKEGRVKWDQEYAVSEYVWKVSQDRALSNVPLRRDGKYNIRELYQAMTIYSANAATIAIAETIAGSEGNFVKMMNEKAAELGLKDYKFVNSSGLNNSDLKGNHSVGNEDEENVMSARATAKLASRLLKEFPEVLETASTPKMKFREGTDDEIEMQNWNWMLPGLVFGYEGVDGLKTGTTEFAGLCFTGTAMRNNTRYITVLMNARDANGSTANKKARFDETKKMFDYAFSNYSKEEIIPEGYQVKGKKSLPVTKGKEDKVKIEVKDAITLVVKNGEKENYQPQLLLDKKKLNDKGELTAPIKKGEKVGTLTIKAENEQDIAFLNENGQESIQVDVVAAQDIEKANWFVLMMRGIGSFFGDLWGSISSTVKNWF